MRSSRSYYSAPIVDFLRQSSDEILGQLTANSGFDVTLGQRQAWLSQIQLLHQALEGHTIGHILMEYNIPRMGKRIDAVLLFSGVIAILEFKVGSATFDRYADDQVMDYALDLKYFHSGSRNNVLVPIVVATSATSGTRLTSEISDDLVTGGWHVTSADLKPTLVQLSEMSAPQPIVPTEWINALYPPTPTIIEAAQVLFQGHGVDDISRNDASAENLERTSGAIDAIIDHTKAHGSKSICLVTGVPGAGKTLAGLAIANQRHQFEEEEHAVFLSGNGPLVQVLQEALARDDKERSGTQIGKARAKAKSFIQAIHHFRDDALQSDNPPIEKVAVFDEAQRAWDAKQLSKFMREKRGITDMDVSEPGFLIGVLDRHQDWAVIVCLIGEGQEINTGEAGIGPWLEALRDHYPDWQIHLTDRIHSAAYAGGSNVRKILREIDPTRVHYSDDLHLNVSVRSFRSEKLSAFVEALLSVDVGTAKQHFSGLYPKYPIVLTRDLSAAKSWIMDHARGTERYGLTATSGARRLRPHGVWVQHSIEPASWFLNDKLDVRSSYGLEEAATEFDIQGLELDWSIVCWDDDYRFNGNSFEEWSFTGTRWNRMQSEMNRLYLKNAYRVLLTRARQGSVIFVPHGSDEDHTRKHEFYDHTYEYLLSVGIPEI